MKTDFTLGAKVRFNIPGGALARFTTAPIKARITETRAEPGFEHYLGEGFYHITTVPDHRNLIAHEDDLVLGWEGRET